MKSRHSFSMTNKQNPVTSKRASSTEVHSCFTTSPWPPLCLQLYRHEYALTLSSSSLLNVLPLQKHCYFKSPSSPPTGGSQLTSLARNVRDVCYERQTGRAAVQIGQMGDIRGMCKWSQFLTQGVSGLSCWGVCDTTSNMHTQIRTHNNTCSYFSESFVVKSMITQSAVL